MDKWWEGWTEKSSSAVGFKEPASFQPGRWPVSGGNVKEKQATAVCKRFGQIGSDCTALA